MDGHTVSQYFQAFVLWRLSLAVCCASSESQSSSGRNSASVSEQRDRGPFSTDVLSTLTLLPLVLLHPATCQDVRPTPGAPALTSRASALLSFVFLTPPAASRQPPPRAPRAPGLSLDPVSTPEFREKSGGAHSPLMVPVCFLAGAGPRVRVHLLPRAGGYRFPAPERGGSLPLPFIFRYLCVVSRSPLHTSILSAGDVHLKRSRCIFLRLMLILWMFRLVWHLSNWTQGTG